MNSRPDAWLRHTRNDLAFAQLAKDNDFLAQSCDYALQGAEKGLKATLLELGSNHPTPMCSTIWCNALGTKGLTPSN